MNLLNWLKCHLLLLILSLSVVLGIIFQDRLKADYQKLVNQTEQQVSSGSVGLEQEHADISPDESVLPEIAVAPAANEEIESVNQVNVVTEQSAPEKTTDRIVIDQLPEKSVIEQQQVEDNRISDSNFPPENYDPESIPVALPKAATENKVANQNGDFTEGAVTSQIDAYLADLEIARRLYWDGKTAQAQAEYEKLMFSYQERPEAAAELGNLLLQQGNKKGATWAYKNAIPRYINLHREQEAISIIGLLSQYDPATAEKLQKKYW